MNRQQVINQLSANALRVNQHAHPLECVGLLKFLGKQP